MEGAAQVPGHTPADKALIVMTQHRAYHKTLSPLTYEYLALRSHRYDDFPYYVEALKKRADRYNAMRERLFALEAEEHSPVLVIAPEKPVEVGVSEKDGGKLLDLYLQGRAQATQRLDEVRAFLG